MSGATDVTAATSVTSTSCVINGLEPSQTYTVTICATNNANVGPICQSKDLTTLQLTAADISYSNTEHNISEISVQQALDDLYTKFK